MFDFESSTFLLGLDDILKAYKKSLCLNKNIKKEIGFETIAAYKRSLNILNAEEKMSTESLGFADPGLFKNDFLLCPMLGPFFFVIKQPSNQLYLNLHIKT